MGRFAYGRRALRAAANGALAYGSLMAGLLFAATACSVSQDQEVAIGPEVNAFALPGGYVYVNRGLIERAQQLDELAGAIGHEIGHVVRRHSVHEMEKGTKANVAVSLTCTLTRICNSDVAATAIQLGGAALFARYSRKDEAEPELHGVP